MFYSIVQWAFLSLVLIVLVHYLYGFFKETLTVPKIKDLVNRPADAYKEMYETIQKTNYVDREKKTEHNNNNNNNNNENSSNMKDELKTFLNSLSANSATEKTEINSFDYGGSSYSNF